MFETSRRMDFRISVKLVKKMIISIDKMEPNKHGQWHASVNYDGYNEGGGSPLTSEEEVKKQIEYLIERYKSKYKIVIKDNRIKQQTL